MKSKKPFLIVCAAALTLAFALPFMGVSSFAADNSSVSFPVENTQSSSGSFVRFDSSSGSQTTSSISSLSSINLSFVVGDNYTIQFFNNSPGYHYKISYYDSLNVLHDLSSSGATRTVLDPNDFSKFVIGAPVNGDGYYYFVFKRPDPLAPVSDGMDTMISVFGDVIDYIINTPDVAIFVAISVASCAIIPMGIILIKKLIKGY